MDATDNDESDDFARLLAQLNGTAEPEPIAAPPAAPAMPAPAMPAPAMPAPAPPAPPQAPVAPAFGAAAPFPPRVEQPAPASFGTPPGGPGTLTFPSFSAPPADVAPVAPPLPRAPELMGADELAAPPRQVPTLSGPVPTLVSAAALGDLPVPAAVPPQALYEPPQPAVPPQTLYEPPQPFSPPPSNEFASAPAPSAPALFAPESSAPVGVAAPAPAATARTAVPAAGRAPMDFSSLLSTPSTADSEPNPAAPLAFGSAADDDDDEPDIGRSTAGEKIGLVLAILVAPIGLLVGIVAAIRSARRRGWVVGIVRASIAIAAVLTVAIGIGGYYEYTQIKHQQAHDQIAASSAAFCSTIKANPGMAQLPSFGWPSVAASIPDSLKAMQAYEDRWKKLASQSPAGIKPGVSRVAAAAKKIIDAVTVSRTVDDASNVAVMSSVASSSGVPAWYSEYCG